MKLTAENVNAVLMDCLYNEGEDTTGHKAVNGVTIKLGLNPTRLEKHREDILSMLDDLPDGFKEGKGGGMSFLNACMTKDNVQWGEHSNIDELICLGEGIDAVKIQFPREMWSAFPGGMPYFVVAKTKQLEGQEG